MDQEYLRYNSDGERLRCVGNGLWIPEGYELAHKSELDNEVPRTKMPIAKTTWCVMVTVGTCLTLSFMLNSFFIDFSILSLFFIQLATYVFLNMKRVITFAILIYQRFAPNRIRNRCLFEPSCSSYTILVLEKYGVLIGTIKAIKRFLRCKLPNGGEDYP